MSTPVDKLSDEEVSKEYRELTSFENSSVLWGLSEELERRISCPRKRLEAARAMALAAGDMPRGGDREWLE